jgi:hypothetical protein
MSQPVTKTLPLSLVGVDIGHRCWGTDFTMNRLAIRVIQRPTSNHIVYLDHKGKLIDRVKIPGNNSAHISLRDEV